MELRILHILCTQDEAADQVRELVKAYDFIIESWERENEDSHSLYYLINGQEQELYDKLEKIADDEGCLRLIVQSVEASSPHNFEEKKQEEEENKPQFFNIISREEMAEAVKNQARLNGSYLSLIIISAIVATIALMESNSVILIGAMVLTPLLGPNLALAFSTATSDTTLTRRAFLSGGAGFFLTFLVAALTGWATGRAAGEDITTLLLGYGFESIPVAVCAGLAATILLLQGTLSSLIGVMVAVAFLPPLAMTGLALSAGDYLPPDQIIYC
jgi:uncharacterized hydrophobic protein (TIGR00341 family)